MKVLERTGRRPVFPSKPFQTLFSCGCEHTLGSRKLHDPLVWSNFLLFIPSLSFYEKGFLLASGCLLVSGFASFLYHRAIEHDYWLFFDRLAAVTAFLTTFPLVIFSADIFCQAIGAFLIFCALVFKHLQVYNYKVFHSMWHITIAAGQVYLCLLTEEECFITRFHASF
mmetsp:Transcript_10726/g.13411  ORF Transcript_10726/g.13411 Transcript_10726/m.13411 type:complete len:169 (+) Transcript_10726:318-824(+)